MAVGEWMFIDAVRLDAIAMNREGWMDGWMRGVCCCSEPSPANGRREEDLDGTQCSADAKLRVLSFAGKFCQQSQEVLVGCAFRCLLPFTARLGPPLGQLLGEGQERVPVACPGSALFGVTGVACRLGAVLR